MKRSLILLLFCVAPAILPAAFAQTLDQRIDYVMYRGGFSVADFHLVGNTVGDRMSTGRWPSDHAGVTATLMQ